MTNNKLFNEILTELYEETISFHQKMSRDMKLCETRLGKVLLGEERVKEVLDYQKDLIAGDIVNEKA